MLLQSSPASARTGALEPPAAYFAALAQVHQRLDFVAVSTLLQHLAAVCDRNGTLYTLGNGGSAALASHWACDYSKGTSDLIPQRRMRVVSLADNAALVTAWANDVAYDQIFAQQLEGVLTARDAVLAISGSGNSPNVLCALKAARRHGADCLEI